MWNSTNVLSAYKSSTIIHYILTFMRKNYLQLALAATLTMAATATVSAQQNTQNEVQKLTRSVLPQQSLASIKMWLTYP